MLFGRMMMAVSAAAPVGNITMTRLANVGSGATASVYNFTPAVSTHGGKTVAVMVNVSANNALDALPTGVTVAGVAFTMQAGQFREINLGTFSIWSGTLPGSPANTMQITFANSVAQVGGWTYILDGANPTAHDTLWNDTNGVAASSLSGTIDTPTNGFLLVGSISGAASVTTTWSGSAAFTEVTEQTFNTTKSRNDAYREGGPYSGETVTATFSASDEHQIVGASFAPA